MLAVACPKVIFYVFWPAIHKAMTVANVQAGFRETGVFPVNRNQIHPALLGPSQTTDNVANAQGKENVPVPYCVALYSLLCHVSLLVENN